MKFDEQFTMETDNWDAALMMRTNELLVEIRRYHVDAEATRLQLASAAASMTRKVDELPATVRHVVEEALYQDMLNADRALLAQRLDRSSRMLEELSEQFNSSGLLLLKRSRRVSMTLIFIGIVIGAAVGVWVTINGSKSIRLSAEALELQRVISDLQEDQSQLIIKTCFDPFSRPRLCTRVNRSLIGVNESYLFIGR